MTAATKGEGGHASEKWLEYGCSPWRLSTQRAADIYDSGLKLWRREDLVDIEQQLEESFTMEKFTVRRLDGSGVCIRNPYVRGTKANLVGPVCLIVDGVKLYTNYL